MTNAVDAEAGSPLQPPRAISLAANLVWCYLFFTSVGTIDFFLHLLHAASAATVIRAILFFSVFLGIGVFLIVFLTYKILKGRNWARIIFFCLFMPSFLSLLSDLSNWHDHNVLFGKYTLSEGCIIVGFGLYAYAVCLLFTPLANKWFRPSRLSRANLRR